jgi:hypothetical protein
MMTGSNAPTAGRVLVAGTDIHRVKYRERDRLAIHYHQSYQVRRFRKLVPPVLLAPSPTERPLHLRSAQGQAHHGCFRFSFPRCPGNKEH